MAGLNETHNPALNSWVASANMPGCDFPIQNLPFAIFRRLHSTEPFRGGVAIGDQVLDLALLAQSGVLSGIAQQASEAGAQSALNDLMAMGQPACSALRLALSRLLREGSEFELTLRDCLVAQVEVDYARPCHIGDYTDFFSSIHHARRAGALMNPDNPLTPNYQWVPIGYHGRASSIGVSGQQIPRPLGQTKAANASEPTLGPCQWLDYESEIGIFIGTGNAQGQSIAIDQAEQHVFGLCLFNDWSARDIQLWEFQPLGPFLSKSFASTISPWIVTLEALEPWRLPFERAKDDPQPLPYLSSVENSERGSFDITMEVLLETATMREQGRAAQRLSCSNFKYSYWSVAQMVTHHTVSGCNLQAGDLLGSGTQSGPVVEESGSLLELSNGGKQAITLANGESRVFLEDGDVVVMRGWCERPGAARIGFGAAVGQILPAQQTDCG